MIKTSVPNISSFTVITVIVNVVIITPLRLAALIFPDTNSATEGSHFHQITYHYHRIPRASL
jgi:hypothetical protein